MPIDPGGVRLPDPNQPITEGFKLKPTELGLASPAMQLGDSPAETQDIWQNLPDLYWFAEAQDLKPGAGCWPNIPPAPRATAGPCRYS